MKTTAIQLMLLLLLMAAASACTKANPDACCETDAQCIALGIPADEHRACENGQTCSPVTLACVAPECTANTDCDPSTPVCSNRICIAACHTNDDCAADAGTPLCQTETGTCVGCLDASTCGGDSPYCDANTHACRGCAYDAECPSGVCIEADAVCATSDQLLFVSSIGTDTGDCVSAPCATLTYALKKVDDQRAIVHVSGERLGDTSTIQFNRAVVIDGDGTTTFDGPATGSTFGYSNTAPGVVTLERIKLTKGSSSVDVLSIGQGNAMRLFDVAMESCSASVTGSLEVHKLRATSSSLRCTSGTITARRSSFVGSYVAASNCATTLLQNRFDAVTNENVTSLGGPLVVENNVFIAGSEFADVMRIGSNSPGSVVAFNTFVNTATVLQSPAAIKCDASVRVVGNIIAYNSTDPLIGEGCVARSSLFDLAGTDDAVGNTQADVASFFVDRNTGDFHLAPSSPAKGLGEPGLVEVDYDGHARPSPTGSRPDAGAFEAR